MLEIAQIEPVTQRRISPRSRQHDLVVREQCEALYKAGWMPAQISKETGVPKGTITQWAKRYHWTEKRDKIALGTGKNVATTVAHELEYRSAELRDSLSAELLDQAEVLRQNPPRSVGSLINGRAATVKTIVDSGDRLFGWNKPDGQGCLVQIGIVKQLCPDTPQEPPAKPATEPAGNV